MIYRDIYIFHIYIYFIKINESIHQEDIILNVFTPSKKASEPQSKI